MTTLARVFGVSTLALVVASAFACGSGSDSTFGNGNGGNGGGLDGSGGSGGFVDGSGGGGGGGGGGGDGASCSAPVDMYIMFDRSGSMGKDCSIGASTNSKWCHSVNALSGYFKSPGAAGQAAAIQFFPLGGAATSPTVCASGDGYQTAAAPSGAYTDLPTNSFDSLLNSTSPDNANGGTPTEAAIRGLATFTAANRRGGRVTIGILVTDGNPNGCEDQDLTALSNILAAHNTATQVRTYVIGMQGADDNNLEQISQGGAAPLHPGTVGAITGTCGSGTSPCRHWNVGDGNPATFTAALAAIQASADGCKDGGGFVNPR